MGLWITFLDNRGIKHDFSEAPDVPQGDEVQHGVAETSDAAASEVDFDDPNFVLKEFAPHGQMDTSDFLGKLAAYYIKKICRHIGHLIQIYFVFSYMIVICKPTTEDLFSLNLICQRVSHSTNHSLDYLTTIDY